jgi:hypothetical protein
MCEKNGRDRKSRSTVGGQETTARIRLLGDRRTSKIDEGPGGQGRTWPHPSTRREIMTPSQELRGQTRKMIEKRIAEVEAVHALAQVDGAKEIKTAAQVELRFLRRLLTDAS